MIDVWSDVMEELDSIRDFQFWEYHVSHGEALVRSPKSDSHPENLDILLFGVIYVALPRFLPQLQLERPSADEIEYLQNQLDSNRTAEETDMYVFNSKNRRHYVVASAGLQVQRSEMGIFESPFDR